MGVILTNITRKSDDMNIHDIYGAMDDLAGHYGYHEDAIIHVIGRGGNPEPIDGFDDKDGETYGQLFVLGNNGKPVVSSEVVEDAHRKLKTVTQILDHMAERGEQVVSVELVVALLQPTIVALNILEGRR